LNHRAAVDSFAGALFSAEFMLIAFHKPYGVLSQFTVDGSKWRTLQAFHFPRGVYPVGRLDAESEGLLLLSDEGPLADRLLHPRHRHRRVYWAQIERIPTQEALEALASGIEIAGYRTRPARAWQLNPEPVVPPRDPPIRIRKNVPDCWIALELTEGKNHQVRRMTAAVGHPTLRLIRQQIGDFELGDLVAGQWTELGLDERRAVCAGFDSNKAGVARRRRRAQGEP
jgi:23S rRNA pseudouridine2457 synthase